MAPLKKKISEATLRKKKKKKDEEEREELSRSSASTPKANEEPRKSFASSSFEAAEVNEENEVGGAQEPPRRDGSKYQPFPRSQSPYPIGIHGLYCLSESDKLPPPLPPAVPGLEYGKTKPVVLPDNPFMQPGEICTLQEMLREPEPEQPKRPTIKEKLAWRKKQAQALIKNPNADPNFAMLPKGANNRIDSDKVPLQEKVRRALGTPRAPKKLDIPAIFPQKVPPVPSILLAVPVQRPTPCLDAAPPRFCPKILPAKKFDPGPATDNWNNPFGGEHALFHETEEERAKRIGIADEGRAHRKASDRYLALRGQKQLNDPLIGRPPPVSHRQLSQPLKLTEAGVKKLQERMQETKKAFEAIPSPKVHFAPEPQVFVVSCAFSDRSVALGPGTPGPASSHSASNGGQSLSNTGLTTSSDSAAASNDQSLGADEPSASAIPTATDRSTTESVPSASTLSNGSSLNTVEPSNSTAPKSNATYPPLPQRGDRYFRWDRVMLANKSPVAILPTIPVPQGPPPPIPELPAAVRTRSLAIPERFHSPLIEQQTSNPLNIYGIAAQLKPARRFVPKWKKTIVARQPASDPKESSNSDSDYSDSLPPEDEQRLLEVQYTLNKNSERFARYYQSEVDQAHEEVSRLPISDERFEPTAPRAEPGGRSPFDDADDERRRAWEDAANTLTGRGCRMRETFDFERLAAVLPHLAENRDNGNDLDTPRRVGGGEEVIGQAISSNDYYPWQQSNRQVQPHGGGLYHNRSRHDPVEATCPMQPYRGEQHPKPLTPPWINPGQPSNRSDNRNDPNRFAFVEDEEDDDYQPPPPPVPPRSPLRRQQGGYFQKGEAIRQSRLRINSPVQSPYEAEFPPTVASTATASSHNRSPFLPSTTSKPPTYNAYNARQYGGETRVFSSLNPRPLPPLPVPPAPALPPQPSKPTKKKTWPRPFLESGLTVSGVRPAKMETTLQVRPAEYSSVKAKAVEDARQMQATVIEVASKAGKDPPKYALLELIGKGSFGRVYKGKDMTSAAIVAVKIIDIDESDTLNPRLADSYSDFLKEVNALKILSESNARNINHVIEALPVGQSMWMISEYCGGGSIATLMKPTAPGGLQEKWIIPILREVAEAIKWVHQAGIIHRDIKCANVLITEEGGVQLCDFGVAGIIENKLDKRSTVIGTPHWMAPELFSATPSYGKEVDIWAFGSMVYEIATGLPPNVANGIPYERLGSHLKQHVPRLEGGNYSNDLRSLVAYCLEELPSERPTIEQVQKHPYIYGTNTRYPASSLSYLVRAFKMWEDHGGSRKSLFMLGGAQGPSEISTSVADDEWNFSTTAAFDQEVLRQSTPQDVFEAYGKGVALEGFFAEETSRPQAQKPSRRRPPPEALARLPAPLEKIFDPNTLSNYEDNSRNHYGRPIQQPASDLPLRDDTAQTSIRDTMIDLGGHDSETGLSNFPDMETIKANRRGGREEAEDEYTSTLHNFSRPALSDPADINTNRRTQDWKFPSMAPPASADPELSRFPVSYDLPRPTVTPGTGGRPALVHHPTEPIGAAFGGSLLNTQQATLDRLSMRESLIDLDMSMPDVIPSYGRPSTANSDAGSTTSEQMTTGNPFELERHASLYAPLSSESTEITEPEYYITEESAVPARLRSNSGIRDLGEISDFSASDAESSQDPSVDGKYETAYSDSDMPPPPFPTQTPFLRPINQPYTFSHFPELPAPPSEKALSGLASHDEMKDEFNRMLSSMTSQLEAFRNVYSSPQVVHRRGPMPQRRDRKDGVGGAAAGASNSG